MQRLILSNGKKRVGGNIQLAGSKSESNRALIIRALGGGAVEVKNLSNAGDTTTLLRILEDLRISETEQQVVDVGPAGTAMRFLTAYLSMIPGDFLLTGSARMQQRPIGPLVTALQELGADISYTGQVGFPPLRISGGFLCKAQKISMDGSISSQYLSAILMIAPLLSDGLTINILNGLTSEPYLEMTLQMMMDAGARLRRQGDQIIIEPSGYRQSILSVETDWSSASYWLSLAALAEDAGIGLSGLKEQSRQGDRAIVGIMKGLGVATQFTGEGISLSKKSVILPPELSIDFRACPDLAQTVLVCAAALGVSVRFTGVETLKVKETDRVMALKVELAKINVELQGGGPDYVLDASKVSFPEELTIKTYDDHRMAMAFAPLALRCRKVIMEDPDVVGKSYPGFWDDMKKVGMLVQQ